MLKDVKRLFALFSDLLSDDVGTGWNCLERRSTVGCLCLIIWQVRMGVVLAPGRFCAEGKHLIRCGQMRKFRWLIPKWDLDKCTVSICILYNINYKACRNRRRKWYKMVINLETIRDKILEKMTATIWMGKQQRIWEAWDQSGEGPKSRSIGRAKTRGFSHNQEICWKDPNSA